MLIKNISQYLVIITTIVLVNLIITSCQSKCEFAANQDAQKESVQLNDFIFSRVFGSNSCSPKKLFLRLPVNVNVELLNKENLLSGKEYTPKITSFVTFSSQPNTFTISRIDEFKNGFFYTKKDTCLAWKWLKIKGQNSVLTLSMERNLKIHDQNIKSVIFLISLPVEMRDARSDISIERYVWEKETSKVGRIEFFNFNQKYPILRNLFRQRDRGRLQTVDAFSEGKSVDGKIIEEISEISDRGGLHVDREIEELIISKYEKTYLDTADYPPCKIPEDLKK
ncbi:hypothetical protein [Mastigocoleus testarum]|uniref:Lipoprotein n=1 Tax=Mastigocoleus testarum BC008 TaxID=371196 RepID=A0A0V7ZP65_9CYAN|nr:hypothetical protein [Mastigocoleus testarum]KST65542.1 hypothetical protein BC008_42220 [Mastigocoleus testarum BC008]KST66070.1 hypothetical protein BC008_24135 [Mastigocoleus testarum BC008]